MVYDNEQDSHLKPRLRWELGQRAEAKVASLVYFTQAPVFSYPRRGGSEMSKRDFGAAASVFLLHASVKPSAKPHFLPVRR